ncbi:MAG TPA: hypothetical protein VKC63_07500 [Solirubrobacterales bacterium]|nr:hypothetical protein [Solirubrobacterales bacterium]
MAAPLDLATGPLLPMERGLRAWQFADISTHSPGRNIKSNGGDLIVLTISLLAPFALRAFAIASTLAPQRFFSEQLRAWRLA